MIIFGPVLSIVLIDPDWLGRILGLSALLCIPTIFTFVYGIGPIEKINKFLDRKHLWPEYIIKRVGLDGVDVLTKILCLILSGVLFYYLTLPFLKDVELIIKKEAPISMTALVSDTRRNSTSAGIFKSVTLEHGFEKKGNFSTFYFDRQHIIKGKTYEFLYIPNTRIILDAKEVIE